jgi:hypothetical protein
MVRDDEITLSFYGPSRFRVLLVSGLAVELAQETDYPIEGRVRLVVSPSAPTEFTLALRIPHWSLFTRVEVNGEPAGDVRPGGYLRLRRRWAAGDTVEIDLDFTPHIWVGERQCQGLVSIYRGPLLLAYDPRYNRQRHAEGEFATFGGDPWKTTGTALPVPALNMSILSLKPLAWEGAYPPLLLVEAQTADGGLVRLCDFASAGQTGTLYRSWLPAQRLERA